MSAVYSSTISPDLYRQTLANVNAAEVTRQPSLTTQSPTAATPSSTVSISSKALSLSIAASSGLKFALKPLNILASPLRLTSLDTVAPTVVRFTPGDGASGAATNANIALTFAEAVKRGTGAIVLKNALGAVIESFDAATSSRIAISGNSLSLNPTNDLLANTPYFVTFAPGSVKDLAGNNYAGTSAYDFRTGADMAAPTVLRFTPGDGASGAATNANIALTFAEAVKRGTGAIVLKNALGAVIESFDAATSSRIAISGNSLSLNPTNDLLANTQYFVTFAPGSVKDLAGNAYNGTTTYDFRTGADTVAPSVVRFTPGDGVSGAASNANIALTFSEAVKRGSGAIVLKNAAGVVIESFDAATSSKITISGNSLSLNPTNDLLANTQYFVTFAPGSVKDLVGNNYAGTTTYDFRTGADMAAPTVLRFTPGDGASGAATNANIALTFAEAVKRGTGAIVLKNAAGTVVESFDAATSSKISISGNSLSLNPTKDLLANTQYFVSFAPGSVKDLAGNNYAGTSTYDFRTGADTAAPTVVSFTPGDGASGAATNANIALTFAEAVKRGTGAIVLKNAAGTVIESFDAVTSNKITISGNSLSLNPTNDLLANTQYFVSFAPGSVKDLAGNNYAGTTTYDFRTGAGTTSSAPPASDTTAPTVTSFSPTDGSSGAATNANIALTFNESIQRGGGSIVLKNAAGSVIESFDAATSSRITISGNNLSLNPTNDLAANTQYFVTFAPGSVKDLAGNAYAGTTTYDFRTASGNFNIDLVYSGDLTYQSYFDQAKALWEQVINGDLPDINGIDDMRIAASVANIDGPGSILGQASPTYLRPGSNLPYQGTMSFDSADLASMAQNGTLLRVIEHEMGHALGFGSLWTYFGFNNTFGQYTGAKALALYRSMSINNAGATFVPLETVGGSGTVNAHWSEAAFDTELMTGYTEPTGNMPLSRLTIAAMEDLGYQVNYSAASA